MKLNPKKFGEGSRKKKSKKSEARLAKEMKGGQRTPNSGALPGFKGDVVTAELLIDLKETDFMSRKVEVKELEKVTKEALQAGKEPAMVFQFNKVKTIEKKWALIPLSRLEELMEYERIYKDSTGS